MNLDQVLQNEGESGLNTYLYKKTFVKQKSHVFYFQLITLYRLFFRKLLAGVKREMSTQSLENDSYCLVNAKETNNHLRFEISTEKMNELLAHRVICAADIRCLDANSKQCLKALCLKTCLYNSAPALKNKVMITNVKT